TVEYLTYKKYPHELLTASTTLPKDGIAVFILQDTKRNLWWMRDDEGKNFFKWWIQYYEMPADSIHTEILRAYVSYPKMTKQSDVRLLRELRAKYPSGHQLDFDLFSVYMVRSMS